MSFKELVELLQSRAVLRFNGFTGSHIGIAPDERVVVTHPRTGTEYTFNEEGAGLALVDDNGVTLPDGKGFLCHFDFAPHR